MIYRRTPLMLSLTVLYYGQDAHESTISASDIVRVYRLTPGVSASKLTQRKLSRLLLLLLRSFTILLLPVDIPIRYFYHPALIKNIAERQMRISQVPTEFCRRNKAHYLLQLNSRQVTRSENNFARYRKPSWKVIATRIAWGLNVNSKTSRGLCLVESLWLNSRLMAIFLWDASIVLGTVLLLQPHVPLSAVAKCRRPAMYYNAALILRGVPTVSTQFTAYWFWVINTSNVLEHCLRWTQWPLLMAVAREPVTRIPLCRCIVPSILSLYYETLNLASYMSQACRENGRNCR